MTDKKIAALLLKQHNLMDSIKENMRIFSQRAIPQPTEGYIRAKLSGLETLWQDFKANHDQLLTLSSEEMLKEEYFKTQTYALIEDLYCDYSAQYRELLPNQGLIVEKIEKGAKPKIKLPIISVPTFDGDLKDWCNFRNLFLTLIQDRDDLSDVEKLQYLKGSLKGEANSIVKHFEISGPNYKAAWSLLSERYENPRRVIDALLTKLTTLPSIKVESIRAFKTMVDTVNECLHSLTQLHINVDSWDPILLHLLLPKLPTTTIKEWEKEVGPTTALPPMAKFLRFLTHTFQTMEASQRICSGSTALTSSAAPNPKIRAFLTQSREVQLCPLCKSNHSIRKCNAFLKMTVQGRIESLKDRHICRNCLSLYHSTAQCPSTVTCKHCQRRHHSLLHIAHNRGAQSNGSQSSIHPSAALVQSTPAVASTGNPQPVSQRECAASGLNATDVTSSRDCTSYSFNLTNHAGMLEATNTPFNIGILATVIINVTHQGITVPVRALVDPGSQATFVTTRVTQLLHASTKPASFQVSGLGGMQIHSPLSSVVLDISSIATPGFSYTVESLILAKLTQLLPSKKLCLSGPKQYRHLPLADPHFDSPGPIDMLLGVDVYAQILLPGLHSIPNGLILQATKLGWIIFGSTEEASPQTDTPRITINGLHTLLANDTTLKTFWELESVPIESDESLAIHPCEIHYESNTIRLPDGRYMVGLPFRDKAKDLGRSGHIAKAAFLRMEKRLLQTPEVYQVYQKCFSEYLSLGHMQIARKSEDSYKISDGSPGKYRCFYMPHHGVIKDSTTTQLRVVFNASQKTENGKSLNDHLHTGPKLQNDILAILIRWRLFLIALTADIAKMYRQIWVRPSDRVFQRVLWRANPTMPIVEYELKTVTFGVTTAPYLAIRTLNQLAYDEETNYPSINDLVRNNFYIDDFLGGSFDIPSAVDTMIKLKAALHTGGFTLRKWISNSPEALIQVPAEDRETLRIDDEFITVVKTLGVRWNPMHDQLSLQIPSFEAPNILTKRVILFWIAGLFDPMGLLAPIVITCKLFMQQLWLAGLSWDEPVSLLLESEWQRICDNCSTLQPIVIPRWLGFTPKGVIELHGFCDASQKAYAAVFYMRVTDPSGGIQCTLMLSKTRVAPTKTITIPRLELSGAVLMVKLLQYIRCKTPLQDVPCVLWTDSQVVLAWLRREPQAWTTFVANRVHFIQTNSRTAEWLHVPSTDNPADVATRGLSAIQLANCTLWWSGPVWLSRPNYQKTGIPAMCASDQVERNTRVVLSCPVNVSMPWIYKISSLTRLIRVTAYVLRFIRKSKDPQTGSSSLSTAELSEARRRCLHVVQWSAFAIELNHLQKNRSLSSKSPLLSLNPFIDANGLLRIGGRLANSDFSYSEKHPIILPSCHPFTEMVIRHAHAQTLHGGVEMTSSYVRATYWIIRTRSTVRKVLHRCVTCFRHRRHLSEQLMGDLPRERVTVARPFTYTGVDYAGPILLKSVGVRSTKTFKGYIAVFVCFTIKAYHLELVSDLSRDAFLAAFRRFIARRGLPLTVFSDCGTNFVGAHNWLERQRTSISDFAATRGVRWKFIPPAAPHFGGLWEAGVKLVKAHLKRVLGTTVLTFEEYATLLTQVEACLNSRPLCPVTSDARDYSALTPGHFLVGGNLLFPPQPDLIDSTPGYLHRWHRVQHLFQTFWKRWSTDYISRQQPRSKWKRDKPNLKENDLVLLREDRLAPLFWRLGRVVSSIVGDDRRVRVAVVKTADGIVKRPITKLFKLPVDNPTNKDESFLSNLKQ